MVKDAAQRIQTAPESELGQLLRDAVASGEPVLVATGEARYVLGAALDENGHAARAP